MPRILHFPDAHIDMANYGRHDPQSGLPLRVIDFLKSLDAIVDAAIQERVDLVPVSWSATSPGDWYRSPARSARARSPAGFTFATITRR